MSSRDAGMMRTPSWVIERFFDAENRRAFDEILPLVHDSVVCQTWPGGTPVAGRAAFMSALQEMYRDRDATFSVVAMASDPERGVVFAEVEIEGKTSVDVFEVVDGKVVAEREYLGAGY